MNTTVIVTALICATVVALALIAFMGEKNNKK
jgi:hypothetical protein